MTLRSGGSRSGGETGAIVGAESRVGTRTGVKADAVANAKAETGFGKRRKMLSHNSQVDMVVSSGAVGADSADVPDDGEELKSGSEKVGEPDLNAIWNELLSMKQVVEDEHDRKLRRIESDLRWTMTLVGAQFITIIGSAIAMLAGG